MTLKINKSHAVEDLNSSEDEQWAGVAAGKLPVIGYVKSSFPCNLVLYSLKTESAFHLWRFGSSIIKFKSCLKNSANKAVVLLREGIIQVMNLKTLNQEVVIPLHFIQQNLFTKPKAELDLQLITESLPKNFDVGPHLYCYIFNQLNRED